MHKIGRAALILSVALAAAGITATAAQAGDQPAPPPPPWVDAGGKLKLSRGIVPFELSVVGPDGQLVKDNKGLVKKVLIRIGELPPPPKAK